MKRFVEETIWRWAHQDHPKPLVIRGARQVGKSTLVRNAAKALGLTLFEINLEKYLSLDSVFQTLDMERIIPELEGVAKQKIDQKQTLVFLDEIQATPFAIQSLRYFYEEYPGLRVIAAGSLLEFALKDHNFSMPVGRVQYLHLGPMLFEEFLLALGEEYLLDCLREFDLHKGLAQSAHEALLKRHREYLYVGGMPEAILTFSKNRDWFSVTEVHRSITETYQDDFSKYAKKNELIRLQHIFRQVPRHIGVKIKHTNFSRDLASREVRNTLALLENAKLITSVHHSDCSGLPLEAGSHENVYKLLYLDVGLLLHQTGLDWKTILSLDNDKLVHEGVLAEQFIGQHLLDRNRTSRSSNLCYWLREGKKGNAEVDFVISQGSIILPIEVKSGTSGTMKSLHQFLAQKQGTLACRFDLNPPSLQHLENLAHVKGIVQKVRYQFLSLPLYLVGQLDTILSTLGSDVRV